MGATPWSSGRVFNDWLVHSRSDIALLTTELKTGPYPYAGIPWYSTAFGRDGIITALQTLWLEPALARGVLNFLGDHQATEFQPFSDAEPGKIMHETRSGEMNALRELPFGRYYGGVDTTPLFVCLAVAYAEQTGDMALIDRLWPHLCAAAGWMESFTERNPHGFITYQRMEGSGLLNQGWKDSQDSRLPQAMAACRPVRSRWSRCRATPSTPIAAWPIWPAGAAIAPRPIIGKSSPTRSGTGWKPNSGWRRPAIMPWRSTARASNARSAPRTPAIFCSSACPARSGRRASPSG
jgi:hypothetical protein